MSWVKDILGDKAKGLLGHKCETISRDELSLPGPDFVDRVFGPTDRSPRVLASLGRVGPQPSPGRAARRRDSRSGGGGRTTGLPGPAGCARRRV